MEEFVDDFASEFVYEFVEQFIDEFVNEFSDEFVAESGMRRQFYCSSTSGKGRYLLASSGPLEELGR